jgi:hypothetical protein
MGRLEEWVLLEENGKMVFRYMKAIPTRGICLRCHGEKIDPSLRMVLDRFYPEDQATGFEIGDVRGAFTIIKPL